jgi:hypothetical protein
LNRAGGVALDGLRIHQHDRPIFGTSCRNLAADFTGRQNHRQEHDGAQ